LQLGSNSAIYTGTRAQGIAFIIPFQGFQAFSR
jgi:hypothetical protein